MDSGAYFGEIALLTNLKRTCSVRGHDFCTLAQMDRETMTIVKEEYPSIWLNFFKSLDQYADYEMEQRRTFVRNVPYLRKVSDKTISQVVYKMREKIYDFKDYVMKKGDITKEIFIVWKGEISVHVTSNRGEEHYFDTLNEGSCFAVYSAFKSDVPGLFDFKVKTNTAQVFIVQVADLEFLAKKDLELADGIK